MVGVLFTTQLITHLNVNTTGKQKYINISVIMIMCIHNDISTCIENIEVSIRPTWYKIWLLSLIM